MIVLQLINTILLLIGITGFVLFMVVLYKLNNALDIWLEKNKKE